MTKKLEEEFNLPPLEEAIEQETVTEEKSVEETVTELVDSKQEEIEKKFTKE